MIWDAIAIEQRTVKIKSISRECTRIHNYTIDSFYWCDLAFIWAWISNYLHCKLWDEISYPFPNFHSPSCTVEVHERVNHFVSRFTRYVITYPCRVLLEWWALCHVLLGQVWHALSIKLVWKIETIDLSVCCVLICLWRLSLILAARAKGPVSNVVLLHKVSPNLKGNFVEIYSEFQVIFFI